MGLQVWTYLLDSIHFGVHRWLWLPKDLRRCKLFGSRAWSIDLLWWRINIMVRFGPELDLSYYCR